MPYITSVERIGIRKGLEQGREEGREEGLREGLLRGLAKGLTAKFGPDGAALAEAVAESEDIALLEALLDRVWSATTVTELRAMLPPLPPQRPTGA